jgi:3-hydroxyacyl-CoA dehydrogenase/3a,7a,12a-trihydroxy-5b-cholest-24-enoyl-CoA hydratase
MAAEGRLAAPAPSSAPAAAPASAAADAPLGSADIFVAIRDYIEKTPDLAGQIKTIFLFKLTSPDSSFTIDLKADKGAVHTGAVGTPDVTLELADADFLAMTTGGADPQKLYFAGKLKISGNVMASQKLMFLKKVDPKAAADAIAKARASSGGAAAAQAAPTKADAFPGIVKALSERLAKESGLAKEVGATVAFVVGSRAFSLVPEASPAVVDGAKEGAALTIKISEGDLEELAKSGNLKDLYQRGKARMDGDVRIASRITFFKGLV